MQHIPIDAVRAATLSNVMTALNVIVYVIAMIQFSSWFGPFMAALFTVGFVFILALLEIHDKAYTIEVDDDGK